jgi:hypothetical protein
MTYIKCIPKSAFRIPKPGTRPKGRESEGQIQRRSQSAVGGIHEMSGLRLGSMHQAQPLEQSLRLDSIGWCSFQFLVRTILLCTGVELDYEMPVAHYRGEIFLDTAQLS